MEFFATNFAPIVRYLPLGFGVLGEDNVFTGGSGSGYYLADVRTLANTIRIVRVKNGNTFICSGANGRFFEVTKEGRTVWEYINPLFGKKRSPPGMGRPDRKGPPGDRMRGNRPGRRGGPPGKDEPQNSVFRAYRYGADYAAFEGKDLTPGKILEALISPAKPEREETANENLIVLNRVQFHQIVPRNARVEKLAGGLRFTEGPVWIPEGGYLLFSDIPADEIKKWQLGEVNTFRKPSHNTNGNLLDPQGRLLSCEHGSRSLTRTQENGEVETLVDHFEGKKLNSPNDLAVRSDGVRWDNPSTAAIVSESRATRSDSLARSTQTER